MAPSTAGARSWSVPPARSPGLQELTEDMALPLESLQAELLMVVGEDDYNFDSVM